MEQLDDEGIQTVNALDLWEFLKIETRFDTWLQRRINEYGFKKDSDFIVLPKNEHNLKGGRPPKEYHISLKMAKQLSMVENNDKGRQARLYFIDCEEELKKQTPQDDQVLSSITKMLSDFRKDVREEITELKDYFVHNAVIEFHGQQLSTMRDESGVQVAMKPVVEGMGLNWSGQNEKLNGWLFSVNPEKVNPEVKTTIELYQEECFKAMASLRDIFLSALSRNRLLGLLLINFSRVSN